MDRQQFVDFVKGSQTTLRRYLVALCHGDTALADDIAQETYIKAYMGADSFRDSAKFNAWIHSIAYNTFINTIRSHRPYCNLDDPEPRLLSVETEDAFRYQELYAALENLGHRERNVTLLFYMEGYSTKEIADIMNLTEANIRQILSRSRSKLKKLIKPRQ